MSLRYSSLMLIAWVSISSSSVLVLLSGSTAIVCAFWRVFIATLIIGAYATVNHVLGRGGFEDLGFKTLITALTAGVLLGIHFLVWMESLFLIPVALSTTVVVTYPLINALVEGMYYRVIRGGEVAGLVLAFVGVFIATRPQTGTHLVSAGITLAAVGALCAAGYFHLGRISRSTGASLTAYTTTAYAAASATIGLYSLFTKTPLLPTTTSSWIYILLLALIPMLGGHTTMNYLLKRMKSYVVTSIALGEPPGATLLASVLLKQPIHVETVLGMMFALSGVAITVYSSSRAPR